MKITKKCYYKVLKNDTIYIGILHALQEIVTKSLDEGRKLWKI